MSGEIVYPEQMYIGQILEIYSRVPHVVHGNWGQTHERRGPYAKRLAIVCGFRLQTNGKIMPVYLCRRKNLGQDDWCVVPVGHIGTFLCGKTVTTYKKDYRDFAKMLKAGYASLDFSPKIGQLCYCYNKIVGRIIKFHLDATTIYIDTASIDDMQRQQKRYCDSCSCMYKFPIFEQKSQEGIKELLDVSLSDLLTV